MDEFIKDAACYIKLHAASFIIHTYKHYLINF